MNRSASSSSRDLLAGRLRDEAMAARPEFSEELHARCREAVEQSESHCPAPALRTGAGRRAWRMAAAACAIAATVLVVLAVRQSWHPQQSDVPGVEATIDVAAEEIPDPSAAVAEIGSAAVEDLLAVVDVQAESGPWADLNHDAKVAIQTLADHVPVDVSTALAQSDPIAGPAAESARP